MKVCFVAINAKYIHTAPAVRLLNKITQTKYESNFYEFTIKDKIDSIINIIKGYDIIGLSCYIWNIEYMLELSKELKKRFSTKIIFAGGPEVSYDVEHYIKNFDFIICGEGEEVILPFLDAIFSNTDIPRGIASKDNVDVETLTVKNMDNVPNILDTYTEEDRKNRIVYLETTRGCPFNCSYCLSSVEKGVRFFDENCINRLFDFIVNNDFKCIKFLDRTFNVNPKRFLKICRLLESTKNNYQFEIAADLFDDEVINYFIEEVTPNKFRLEIGIQSLMKEAILAVDRYQDNERLITIIKKINQAGRVVIHVDLIAGLPFETLSIFKETFNKTFLLQCEELQLGFLKLLRGTKIRKQADLYKYQYQQKAPYEVISNKFISEDELKIIHECENALDWMWNHKRCVELLKHLIEDNVIKNFFDFFVGFNNYYDKNKQLYENYASLCQYLKDTDLFKQDYIDDLKYDYLKTIKIKPKPFWPLEESIEYYRKLLGYYNTNYFITPYYTKYIIIKYEKNKIPELIIE